MLTPLEKSEFMKKNIKNSSMQIIHAAAHLSNLEQPNSFNQYIRDFVEGI